MTSPGTVYADGGSVKSARGTPGCFIVERTGRAPTIVTSNRDTAEWLAAFDETLLAQSAVDRFIHNAYDLVIEGESYRARLKPKLRDDDPPPSTPNEKKTTIGRRR